MPGCSASSAPPACRWRRWKRRIEQLQRLGDGFPFGINLIHSPNEPDLENALVDLYLRRNVRLVEASAFLDLTLPLVRYRTHGIGRDAAGRIVAPNRIIAKISREEVAAKFMAPPPERLLRELVAAGDLTADQAELAAQIPMAQDITAEADSGGHTDNRPALALAADDPGAARPLAGAVPLSASRCASASAAVSPPRPPPRRLLPWAPPTW